MPTRRRRPDQKFVMISVVAERYGIHPQTLRLYDEEAIRRLEIILTLTRDLGVNLAGVELLLKIRDQRDELHRILSQLTHELEESLDLDESESDA